MRMKKTLIIGAGLTGLTIANSIPNCTVVEKSKGVGGRLATRRWNEQKFDHGAQFYKLSETSEAFHDLVKSADLVKPLMDPKWCAKNGMSSLAKKLAENVSLQLEKHVTKISGKTEVHFLNGEVENYDQIIFTCPLPQTLKILKDSEISYPESLDKILYAKALVFLVSSKESISAMFSPHYVENPTAEIFSFTDQNWKTSASGTAWTITMNPTFSEKHFELTDEQIIAEFKKVVTIDQMEIQLKKWRYSHPLTQDTELFLKLDNVYLAGDAFGGGSINGALRSAAGVLKSLS